MRTDGRYVGLRFTFAAWTVALFLMLNLFAMLRNRGFEESEYTADHKMEQLQKQNSQLQQQVAEIKATLKSSFSASGELVPLGGIGLSNTTAKLQGMLRHPEMTANDRRLLKVSSVVTTNTATSGCFAFTSSGDDATLGIGAGTANVYTYQVSSSSCRDSNRCPTCFIATSLSALGSIVIRDCSSFVVGSSAMSDKSLELTFINADSTYNLNVYFGDSAGNPLGGVYKSISPGSFSTATCNAIGATRTSIAQWLGSTVTIR